MPRQPNEATGMLAEFMAELTYDQLPAEVVHEVKRRVLDVAGISLSASGTEVGLGLAENVLARRTPGRAALWGRRETTSPALASLVNASMVFHMELDDVHRTSHCHPAVTTVVPALALSDGMKRSGREIICAIVAGYDAETRIGDTVSPSVYLDRNFLPASTLGTFGAAGVAAKLYGLDAEETRAALGTAAFLTPLAQYENYTQGSSSKELSMGWACLSGLNAVDFARQGFVGPPSWLEGPLGFARAAADKYDLDRLIENIGREYQVMKSGIKPYACCRQHHSAIDAALAIREQYALDPEQIERIVHRTFVVGSRGNNCRPTTIAGAKYSAPFSIAIALIQGRAWRQEYTMAKMDDEKTMSLAARVEVIADQELEALYDFKWPSIVEVYMKDGQKYQARRDLPKGEPEHYLSDADLKAKFMDLATDLVSNSKAEEIYRTIMNLENLPDSESVTALLRAD